MARQKSVMELMIEAMTNAADTTLRLHFQKQAMLDALLSPKER